MLIKNGKLLLEDYFDYHDLVITEGKIDKILPLWSNYPDKEVYDAQGSIIIPGMIDLEVHGAAGYDISDACPEAYGAISDYLLRHGVTSYVGAVDSFEEEILEEACSAAGEWMKEDHPGAKMIGLQLRGPFLNPETAGPQNRNALRKPDAELYRKLQKLSGGNIRIVNISPELEGAVPFIREVSKEAIVALSNSAADYDTARAGYSWGAKWCGDLLNNMPVLSALDPGLFGASMDAATWATLRFENDKLIHPGMLRLAFRLFWGRLVLVSGVTAYAGLPSGTYEIEGHTVTKQYNSAVFEDGSDAGCALTLDSCVQAVLNMGSVPIPAVFTAATEMAAKALGIYDEVGSITPGKRADLAILDLHTHNVQTVLQNGKIVFDERKSYD